MAQNPGLYSILLALTQLQCPVTELRRFSSLTQLLHVKVFPFINYTPNYVHVEKRIRADPWREILHLNREIFLYAVLCNTASSAALRFHCVGGCWDRTQDAVATLALATY